MKELLYWPIYTNNKIDVKKCILINFQQFVDSTNNNTIINNNNIQLHNIKYTVINNTVIYSVSNNVRNVRKRKGLNNKNRFWIRKIPSNSSSRYARIY